MGSVQLSSHGSAQHGHLNGNWKKTIEDGSLPQCHFYTLRHGEVHYIDRKFSELKPEGKED